MKKKITEKVINQMSYTEFISFIQETNRCPGGKDTIRKIAQNTFINKESLILDVGSNTGFTSFELAHISNATIRGIDVSKDCVETATNLLNKDIQSVKERVSFQVGTAYKIPFESDTFDLVVTGGATSFMDEKRKAISEYFRVLKPWGFLSATQLFYHTKPPQKMLDSVSEVIGVKIEPWMENDWKKIFLNFDKTKELELYYYELNRLKSRPMNVIEEYIEYFLDKQHLSHLSDSIKESIRKKWLNYISIFNENHKYLGYFIAIFRKNYYEEEPELFIRDING